MRDNIFTGSRTIAIKRFDRLERKLGSDDKLRVRYNAFMAEYAPLGHTSVASSPGRYFIPHHAVFNAEDKIHNVNTPQLYHCVSTTFPAASRQLL